MQMCTGHIAQCKLHCKNCTTTVAHLELSLNNIICSLKKMDNCTECWFWRPSISCSSINKMGWLHRMLILKTCPYQQILSSKGAETTNGTASQHIHINKYADLPDGSTIQIVDSGPLFTFLVIPKQQFGTRVLYVLYTQLTTARPSWYFDDVTLANENTNLISLNL